MFIKIFFLSVHGEINNTRQEGTPAPRSGTQTCLLVFGALRAVFFGFKPFTAWGG